MQKGVFHNWLRWLADVSLLAAIHCDAFRIAPIAYLAAARWHLVGKRVRARGRLAPLLSRSPLAYTYWSLKAGQRADSDRVARPVPAIVAIMLPGRPDLLAASLRNLSAQGVAAVVAGDPVAAAAAIDWTAQPWLLPMAAGDILAPGAAAAYQAAMGGTAAGLIYADDDTFDRWGRRTAPHFKPDWNSELLDQYDYLTGACVLRCDRQSLTDLAGKPDWPAILVREAAHRHGACHLHQVLHHRRERPALPQATAPLQPKSPLPRVSVIVPTRNRVDLLRTCLNGLWATDYPELEILVIDNDSDDPATLAYLDSLDPARAQVLRHPGPFNYSGLTRITLPSRTTMWTCACASTSAAGSRCTNPAQC